MGNKTYGAIAGTRGIRVGQLHLASVKPWAPVRPADLAGLPVIAAVTARPLGAELCPSPDRFSVTPSFPAMDAARPADRMADATRTAAFEFRSAAFEPSVTSGVTAAYPQAFGVFADGDVPTSKGSIRPAPPG
jgi:hypothetical protein